jgi:hypothetical protein
VALLTIRAWCEVRSDHPLRAEIRLTRDVSSGFQHTLTVVHTKMVIEAVQVFLEDVLLSCRSGTDPCHAGVTPWSQGAVQADVAAGRPADGALGAPRDEEYGEDF